MIFKLMKAVTQSWTPLPLIVQLLIIRVLILSSQNHRPSRPWTNPVMYHWSNQLQLMCYYKIFYGQSCHTKTQCLRHLSSLDLIVYSFYCCFKKYLIENVMSFLNLKFNLNSCSINLQILFLKLTRQTCEICGTPYERSMFTILIIITLFQNDIVFTTKNKIRNTKSYSIQLK
jgi:hypothetical protein